MEQRASRQCRGSFWNFSTINQDSVESFGNFFSWESSTHWGELNLLPLNGIKHHIDPSRTQGEKFCGAVRFAGTCLGAKAFHPYTLQESNAHLCERAVNQRPLLPESDGVLLSEALMLASFMRQWCSHVWFIYIIYGSIFSWLIQFKNKQTKQNKTAQLSCHYLEKAKNPFAESANHAGAVLGFPGS